MRWFAMLALAIIAASQTGCQNFGGSGYPMQSVTRVPPPATGSYPVGGSYYNAPSGTQTSVSPTLDTSASLASLSDSAQSADPQNPTNASDFGSNVSPAQYTQPATTYPGETINSPQTLQWQ